MQTLNIGHNASVIGDKVLVILPFNSAPVRAIKKSAKDHDKFIDATYGKPTRSLIILSESVVVASSVLPDTLRDRLKVNEPQPE